MGRAQLSSRFGIDDLPRRKSPLPEPPKYIDAPFDLDADSPDAVYEAFLTPDQLRDQEERRNAIFVDRAASVSPVEFVESDDASSVTTTQPSTRVPSPVREDRSASPQHQLASPTADRGSRVLELLEPLTSARAAALPAIEAAVAAGISQVQPLVVRLLSILRPHIEAALAPFLADVPEVEFLGHMFERSIILDMLGVDGSARRAGGPGFSRNEILTALDAVGDQLGSIGRMEGRDEDMEEDDMSDVASELDADPASEDHPLAASVRSVTPDDLFARTPSPSLAGPTGWNTYAGFTTSRSFAQPSPTLQGLRSAPLRAFSPLAMSSPTMDVDTDDESGRSSGSGFSGRSASGFVPRVYRAHAPVITVSAVHHDPFLPIDHYRLPEPLR